MKAYRFLVSFCNGWCDGFLAVKAFDEDSAYDKAMDIVVTRLANSFPELGIDYNVELYDEDMC